MARYQVEGYFSTEQCVRIKAKFEGKTYMKFHIEYGGIAHNNTILVAGEGCTDKELKEMFIYVALNSI